MANARTVALAVVFGSLFITAIVLFAVSWSTLEFTEWGLDYSSITKHLDPNAKDNGRYFLGLGHSFIRFPNTVQTIEFSDISKNTTGGPGALKSRTSDGLEVTLEISFQYRLIFSELNQLYLKFLDDYESVFVNMARDVVTDAASQYTAYTFFSNRTLIGNYMQNVTAQQLSTVHATVEFFQLRDVDLPDAFEDAIQQAEVARQLINQAEKQRQVSLVQAETKVIQATFNADVTRTMGNATAQAILIQNHADVQAFQITQEALSDAYTNLTTGLSLSPEELLQFMKAEAIREHDPSKVVISLDKIAES